MPLYAPGGDSSIEGEGTGAHANLSLRNEQGQVQADLLAVSLSNMIQQDQNPDQHSELPTNQEWGGGETEQRQADVPMQAAWDASHSAASFLLAAHHTAGAPAGHHTAGPPGKMSVMNNQHDRAGVEVADQSAWERREGEGAANVPFPVGGNGGGAAGGSIPSDQMLAIISAAATAATTAAASAMQLAWSHHRLHPQAEEEERLDLLAGAPAAAHGYDDWQQHQKLVTVYPSERSRPIHREPQGRGTSGGGWGEDGGGGNGGGPRVVKLGNPRVMSRRPVTVASPHAVRMPAFRDVPRWLAAPEAGADAEAEATTAVMGREGGRATELAVAEGRHAESPCNHDVLLPVGRAAEGGTDDASGSNQAAGSNQVLSGAGVSGSTALFSDLMARPSPSMNRIAAFAAGEAGQASLARGPMAVPGPLPSPHPSGLAPTMGVSMGGGGATPTRSRGAAGFTAGPKAAPAPAAPLGNGIPAPRVRLRSPPRAPAADLASGTFLQPHGDHDPARNLLPPAPVPPPPAPRQPLPLELKASVNQVEAWTYSRLLTAATCDLNIRLINSSTSMLSLPQALEVIQNPDSTRGQRSAAYPPLMEDLERSVAER